MKDQKSRALGPGWVWRVGPVKRDASWRNVATVKLWPGPSSRSGVLESQLKQHRMQVTATVTRSSTATTPITAVSMAADPLSKHGACGSLSSPSKPGWGSLGPAKPRRGPWPCLP